MILYSNRLSWGWQTWAIVTLWAFYSFVAYTYVFFKIHIAITGHFGLRNTSTDRYTFLKGIYIFSPTRIGNWLYFLQKSYYMHPPKDQYLRGRFGGYERKGMKAKLLNFAGCWIQVYIDKYWWLVGYTHNYDFYRFYKQLSIFVGVYLQIPLSQFTQYKNLLFVYMVLLQISIVYNSCELVKFWLLFGNAKVNLFFW